MATDVAGTGLPWIEEIGRSFEHRPFVAFHRRELPVLLEQHGHLVVGDVQGAPDLAFRVDGTSFRWTATTTGVAVVEGDDAPTVVELSEAAFSDFVNELLTASGAVRTGRAVVTHGELAGWQRWE